MLTSDVLTSNAHLLISEVDDDMVRERNGQHPELHRAAHAEDSLDAAWADAVMHFPCCRRLLLLSGRLMECTHIKFCGALSLPDLPQLVLRLSIAEAVGDSASGMCRCRQVDI